MEVNGIPYTQHWGKTNGYSRDRIRAAYGANVDKWIAARQRLLPGITDRRMFDNDFVRQMGLDI